MRVPPMPSGEGLAAQRGVRVHHLEVEERTVVGERRRNVAEQFEGDGTVQLGVRDHACSEGAVGKVAAPVVLVAPRGELPAQECRCGRVDASVSISSAATATRMIENRTLTTLEKA